MLKKNFEAATSLTPLKKHVIQLCGEEFIKALNRKGFYIKDDNLWLEVNTKLEIPCDAYILKQKKEREEIGKDSGHQRSLSGKDFRILQVSRKFVLSQ